MEIICTVCGSRGISYKCSCGYEYTKNYDTFRTIGAISGGVISTYKQRKIYDDKTLKEKSTESANYLLKERIYVLEREIEKLKNGNVAKSTSAPTTPVKPVVNQYGAEKKVVSNKNTNDQKDAISLFNQANAYYTGKGEKLDYDKAFKFAEMSAKGGNADAMNLLGKMYKDGKGTVKNGKMAREYFVDAISAGNKESYYNLGCMYYYGDGIDKNYTLAMQLLKKSADAGNEAAKRLLPNRYS